MRPPEWERVGQSVTSLRLSNYPLIRSGKVRDLFDLGDALLIVATDRISAFDVVLPTSIPDKGKILTAISEFWFDRVSEVVPGHRTGRSLDGLNLSRGEHDRLQGRSVIAQKADRIDIECVVRGYLVGSGWKEYRQNGTLAGEALPSGMRPGDRLPEPRFTPAIKNEEGHDQNIGRGELAELVGRELASLLETRSLELFQVGTAIARKAGFILADTKFEFGDVSGNLTLIDEALTPDSSRYWNVMDVDPGSEPPSFDKQIVRDWLETTTWDKTYPGPELPESIVVEVRQRYLHVLERLERTDWNGGATH